MTEPKPGKVHEGALTPPDDARFAIVASRFNDFVVGHLVAGAVDTLRRHGVAEERVELVRVPGSWELPLLARRLAKSGRFAAVIALGAVIRGATPHFDHVANAAARGLSQAMMDSDVPVLFGVLTTDTLEQAIERAGSKAGNKGSDAAVAALELVGLDEALSADGI